MIRKITITLLATVIFGAGMGAEKVLTQDRKPYCPTEDSCKIDYHDGEWHITPEVAVYLP
jgi:hypothetical protein